MSERYVGGYIALSGYSQVPAQWPDLEIPSCFTTLLLAPNHEKRKETMTDFSRDTNIADVRQGYKFRLMTKDHYGVPARLLEYFRFTDLAEAEKAYISFDMSNWVDRSYGRVNVIEEENLVLSSLETYLYAIGTEQDPNYDPDA